MLKKSRIKNLIKDFIAIVGGSVCYAVAIGVFSAPNEIAPGGVTGIATLLNYLSLQHLPFELPIGFTTIVMNLPLMIAAWKVLGRGLAIRSVWGIVLSSIFVDFVPTEWAYTKDPILVCIFGGVVLGLGVGLILSRGGTTGGSEIISRLLEKKYPHMSVGSLILVVDAIVITLSAIVYGEIENAMYAVVFVFLGSQVIDWVVYGGRSGKMVMVLSKKQEEVTAAIMEKVDRGVTLLKAQGGYSGADQKMILCAVRSNEVFRLRQVVFDIDAEAFVMTLSTDEVRGYRWLKPHE